MTLTLRNRIKVLIYIGAAAVLVMSYFDNGPRPGLTGRRLVLLETVLFAVITVFDRWVWRWWVVPSLLRTGPVLRGTWKGTIRPTDGSNGSVHAFLSVRQTFSGINFRLITEESVSESTSAVLAGRPEGLAIADYTFSNTPRDAVRDRSPIHFGAAHLECVGQRPLRLEGSYFTSRKTSGELEFSERSARLAHSFADARAAFIK